MTAPGPMVVCIGHATLDLVTLIDGPPPDDARILADDAVLAGGGPAATAAVALARLGVPTAFLGTVGRDLAGDFVIDGLTREGVDVAGIRRIDGATAISAIWVDRASGRRSIAAFYRAAGIDQLTRADLKLTRAAAWVHLDSPGFRAASMLRAAGVATPISLDAGNPVPGIDLSLVDLYVPTETRLIDGHGTTLDGAVAAVLAAGPRLVVATRGGAGSVGAKHAESVGAGRAGTVGAQRARSSPAPGTLVVAPPFEIPVVSTLGAGDVFHGALLAGLVRGLDLEPAMTLANAVAALSCRALDGRTAIPGWDEALAFASRMGRPIDGTRVAHASTRRGAAAGDG